MPAQAPQDTRPAPEGAVPDQKLPQVKAEDLRDQILAVPGLSGLDAPAVLAVLAAALLAESEDGYTRDAALGILQRARKVSTDQLAAAVQQVTAQLADAMTAFWSAFIQETWQSKDPPPQYVDPAVVAKRKALEEQEQEENRKVATQYVDKAQVAIGALSIDDKEFPQHQGSPKKPGLNIDLGKVIHGLLYKPAPGKAGGDPNGPPGWLTAPLVDRHSEDVTIFDNDVMDIVAGRKLSGEQAWKKLEDRGYDRQRIVRTIYNVRQTAQDQIAQCDQILSFIRTDYQTRIEPVVKAAVLLGHAISVVNSFYAPLAVPPDRDNLGTRASLTAPRRRGG